MTSKDFRFGANQGIQIRARDVQHPEPSQLREPRGGASGRHGRACPSPMRVAGTFGYMLGPLNRTVGLGTARQTQISIRFLF